jgi:tetratricopeptide (TPR) repeat protein
MTPSPVRPTSTHLIPWIVAVGFAVLTAVTYRHPVASPFLFDDHPAIVANPSIRDLGDLGAVLWPSLPGGVTTSGRPIGNLSFAIDYALWGLDPGAFRLTNQVILCLSAFGLFALVRSTLPLTPLGRARPQATDLVAIAIAAIWLVHPLQTSVVSSIVQRVESLCALFYLMTLLAFVRSLGSRRERLWQAVSVGACLLGMGTKEVMVTAPVMVFFFDRTFLAGSFAAAWRSRRGYYLSLAATWLLLAVLVASTGGRGETAGLGTIVSPWIYIITQGEVILRYVGLTFWPTGLVFDYGVGTVETFGEAAWSVALVAGMIAATIWALWRHPMVGFVGLWFFGILAPSSSVVPIATQTMAEHRMHLALAAPIVAVVLALARWVPIRLGVGVCCGVVVVAASLQTARRTQDYASEIMIWSDTVTKRPENGRARINLSIALADARHFEEALVQLDAALVNDPMLTDAYYHRGRLLSQLGRTEAAVSDYQQAIRLHPAHAAAWNNLGRLRAERKDPRDAEALFRRAIGADSGYAEAHANLSLALLEQGRTAEAIAAARTAVRLKPDWAEGLFRLGNALREGGQTVESRQAYERAIASDPRHGEAHQNLGNLRIEAGQFMEALEHFRAALAAEPALVAARRNAVLILARAGNLQAALVLAEQGLVIRPGDPALAELAEDLRREIR